MTWERAVSSLGAPGLGLPELVALARRHECTGVELRAGEGGTVDVAMSPAERAHAREALARAGVRALSVASYVQICADVPDEEVLRELSAHVDLAADLGAAGVRVFPGGTGTGDDNRGRRRLAPLIPRLPPGVTLLLETHDSHPRARDVLRLLQDLAGPQVIWDVAHTVVAGEPPAETARLLADHLALVQVKDLTELRRGAQPALPERGVLPLDEVAAALRTIGYAGPVSLEWEKAWHPQIPDLDIALAATMTWLDRVDPPG